MRVQRERCESEIYHVVSRGTGWQLIFEDDWDRGAFLKLLGEVASASSVEILAWCLMGNHFHLLLHAPMPMISECMKALCGRYAQRFNLRHARVGHLFQERFKSEPVEDDAYLAVVTSYIHFNPEKAGIARQDAYRWSSYGEYTGRKGAPSLCSTELVLGVFGGVGAFVRFHEEHAAEASCLDVDRVRTMTRAMPDEEAIALAAGVLHGRRLDSLKSLARPARDSSLESLLVAGLSVRQIERLTGISRGVVQRVSKAIT